MITPETNLSITKSNALVRSSYRLTLNEQRIILACIGQLDSRKPITLQKGGVPRLWRLTAKEFSETFGVDESTAYTLLKEASKTLFHRYIQTHDGRYKEMFRWVSKIGYHEGEGYVELRFTPEVEPYLMGLHTKLTTYNLRQIAEVRSVYSIRLFEFLMQWKKTGVCKITIEDFKLHLDLANKYSRFTDLKKRVLDPAVEELETKAGLLVKWEVKRKKRRLHSLEFRFSENPQGDIFRGLPKHD